MRSLGLLCLIYIISDYGQSGYCSCPFMKTALRQSKIIFKLQGEMKRQLYSDNLVVKSGQPGLDLWSGTILTEDERLDFRNASIGLLAAQLYSQSMLLSTNEPHFSQAERLSIIRSKSKKCIPEQYRCQKLKKKCKPDAPYQALDGTCNNLIHPLLGSSFSAYSRLIKPTYNDGLYEIRRNSVTSGPLKSPRLIGNTLYKTSSFSREPSRTASIGGLFFGQYIGHDFSIRMIEQVENYETVMRCCTEDYTERLPSHLMSLGCLPIDIPRNDDFFSTYNMTCMEFLRGVPIFPKNCELGHIEQGNTATAWLDKSILYGNSKSQTDSLRTMVNGTMRTNTHGMFPKISGCEFNDWRCYMTGESTGTQNLMFSTVILLNLHFHNYMAQRLAQLNSHWNDEKLFQETRRIFLALNQRIIYHEWIPLFIGRDYEMDIENECRHSWPFCNVYEPTVDGNSMLDFTSGAMRMFHQLVPSSFSFYTNSTNIYKTIPLRNVIVRPEILNDNFLLSVRGTLFEPVNVLNTYSHDIRNQLFDRYTKHRIGVDLSSIDIQRGRDMGTGPYYQYMELCSSVKIRTWSDLQPNLSLDHIDKAKQTYDSVFDLDLITGVFLENKIEYMGPVARCIISEQFDRSRRGDRYFYTNAKRPHPFTKEQLYEINNFTYAKLVCANGGIDEVPIQAFEVPSASNPIVSCSSLKALNLNLWKE